MGRRDISGQKGLKQILSRGRGHLHRLRCEFREDFAGKRGAASLWQVSDMVSSGITPVSLQKALDKGERSAR